MPLIRTVFKEIFIALVLLAVGIFGLPALIFTVGQVLIGEYDAGIQGLYEAIGEALVAGRGYAWLMVLSPYLSVQLFRVWLWLRRQRRSVT
jgi:hypothetical protein